MIFILTALSIRADWKDEIGYTRLQTLAASDLPTAPSQGLTQAEAPVTDGMGNNFFYPDPSNAALIGKTFTYKSGAYSGASSHATHVATNFYGNTSLIPGATSVNLYEANNWVTSGFLRRGTFNPPRTETSAVQNHSWIGLVYSSNTEVNQRLDFAINRDGFISVVGENNGNSTVLPDLLGQSYHTITVGRDDGEHSAGFTTNDVTGRIKPDIVAPSASPENATSWCTPMVASAAGMLVAKLSAAPYSLLGADKPRVVKALMLASATKDTVPGWANTSSRPLDLRYGAGELNAYHAYIALRSGRVAASNSTLHSQRNWAAETVPANSTKTYFFNIPSGAPTTPFCAAMTWHRVVDQSIFSWSATLANLNLRLYQASNFTLGNQLASSASTVDNVELIHQSALPPGNYAITVENSSAVNTAYALAWHSLPAATVVATSPNVCESGNLTGQVTLTRTGDTTLPLYVPLTIGGTAVSGTHYNALPASITIPAGQTSTVMQITPIPDGIAQGARTVTVAVAADFALVRDVSQSAVVTIQDNPFECWRIANFGTLELGNPAISSETADPDHDQFVNLIEYALNLNPKSPSASPLIQTHHSGHLALSANKNLNATDITWSAEVSGNLSSWSPATIVTNDSNSFLARDTVLETSAPKRFIRLKITRP
ncbi:MAG: hypothetical protein H8M99_15385 [Gloeobacteraceae cyanobacterium ES-bin-144]|nr:hypothetical protein [Verrucomicrobiales bacterium]